jgi:hypothetical protein
MTFDPGSSPSCTPGKLFTTAARTASTSAAALDVTLPPAIDGMAFLRS